MFGGGALPEIPIKVLWRLAGVLKGVVDALGHDNLDAFELADCTIFYPFDHLVVVDQRAVFDAGLENAVTGGKGICKDTAFVDA